MAVLLMPDLDLDPGSYTERKPRGWRWRLPLAHDDGTRLPFFMFVLMIGFVLYVLLRPDAEPFRWIFGGGLAFGFGIGCMFILWTRP